MTDLYTFEKLSGGQITAPTTETACPNQSELFLFYSLEDVVIGPDERLGCHEQGLEAVHRGVVPKPHRQRSFMLDLSEHINTHNLHPLTCKLNYLNVLV